MELTMQAAKHAYVTKNYNEAKRILLQMISTTECLNNNKYYYKLGDVCMKLKEFKNAARFYKKSITDTMNPQTLIKLIKLFYNNLDNLQEAQRIFEQCHKLYPKNDQCLFDYASLVENKYPNKAIKLYKDCLIINDNRASTYHHLAKLLLKTTQSENNTDISHYLERAVSIQPTVAIYNYEYAIHSQKLGKFNQANHFYQQALNLVNYNDIRMVHDYCKFCVNCIGDKYKAMECFEFAGLTQDNQYLKLQKSLDGNIKDHHQDIKLIIYDLSVITYWPFYANMNELRKMGRLDIIKIFGGKSRIKTLQRHFADISKGCTEDNPIIVILANSSIDVTKEALQRVLLNKYFTDIFMARRQMKRIYDILNIKDHFNLFHADQVLYVSLATDHVQNLLSQCNVYGVDQSLSKPLKGLTPENLIEIGCIITNTEYHPKQIHEYKDGYSLSQIDAKLYKNLVTEIQEYRGSNRVHIDSLPSMNHVISKDYRDWIAFGYKYCEMRNNFLGKKWWECALNLVQLLKYEWNKPYLWTKYAISLSYIGHNEESEFAFKRALQIGSKYYPALFGYGYHLYLIGKYKTAEKVLHDALEFGKLLNNADHDGLRKLYILMARNAAAMNKLDESEYLFKLAVGDDFKTTIIIDGNLKYRKSVTQAHLHYGKYLAKHNRLDEAKQEFEICVRNEPWNCVYHYKLANVLWSLGDHQGFYHHLNRTLEINPFYEKANNDDRNQTITAKSN